ncbi:unnamed protein product [Callosobruchus maculatus]|uniref:Uncharacterized protein n=1 Tax=Callosobruchus maculatus TaxID=64391 RepID=A0A653BS19_CALMS|nr:unnamed protein product [Callosobruchus maculatus]
MLQKRRANFWTEEENEGDTGTIKGYSSNDEKHLLVKRDREITGEPVEATSRRLGSKDIDEFYRNMTWTKVKKKKKQKKKPDQEITTKTWSWPESKDEETKQLWKPFNWDVEHTRKKNESSEITEKTAYQHSDTIGNKTNVGSHLIEWPELIEQETSSREGYHEFNETSWKSYNWDLEHNETVWKIFNWNMEHNETYRKIYNWNMEHKSRSGQVESSSEHTGNISATSLEATSSVHSESNEGENVQSTGQNDYQLYNETFWRTYKWNIEHNATFRNTFEWNIEHNETFRRIYNWNMEHYHINSEDTGSTPEFNEKSSSVQPKESSSLSSEANEDMTIELPTQEDSKEFNATIWTAYNWNIEHNATFRRIFEWNMEHNEKFRTIYKLNMERLKNYNQSESEVSSTSKYSEETTFTKLETPSSEFNKVIEGNANDLTAQENDKEFNATFWRQYNWKIEHDPTFRKTFEWNMEHNEKFRTMYKLNMERLKNYNQSESEVLSTSKYSEETTFTKLETPSSEFNKVSEENANELTTLENDKEFNVTFWRQYNWKIEHDATFRKTFEWNMEHNEKFRTLYKLNMERLKNYNQSESETANVTESDSTTEIEGMEEITTNQQEPTVPREATAVTELSEKEKSKLHSIANQLLNSENNENDLTTSDETQTLGESSEETSILESTLPEAEGIITEEGQLE